MLSGMPVLSSSLRRLLAPLGQLNPIWIAALGALLLALIAGHSMRAHVRDSAQLQDRLTGSALVDALKSYAEASPPGQAPLPASVAELSDDNRGGHHRNWLDGASAEALADNTHWELLRDADGHLRGARIKDPAPGAWRWLPAWLSGSGPSNANESYGVEIEKPAPPPQVAATPAPSLPQPVMPDTPLPQPAVAAAEPPPVPKTPPAALAAAPGEPRVLNAQALDSKAAPSGARPAPAGTGPSRILAGLAARQVLRLSGSGADEPVLTPRKAIPALPVPPHSAAVGAVRSPKHASAGKPAQARQPQAAAPATPGTPAMPGSPAPTALPAAPAAAAPIAAAGPLLLAAPAHAPVAASSSVQTIASGVLRRASRARPVSPPLPADPATTVPAVDGQGQSTPSASSGAAVPSPVPVANGAATGMPAAGVGSGTASAGGNVGSAGNAGGSATPSAVAPARMDTVIYEDNQGAPSDTPRTDCRAMTGDSAECDAFEDSDPGLYQRCYQSLSERINACLAGEPIPPLVTR